MLSKLAKSIGAIVPSNTLNSPASRSSLPLAPYARDETDPPLKKRRVDEDGDKDEDKDDEVETDDQNEDSRYPTLQATFAVDMGRDMPPPERKASFNSTHSAPRWQRAPSVQSTGGTSNYRPPSTHSMGKNSVQQSRVDEYRAMEQRTMLPKKTRQRKKKPVNSASNPEQILDSDEEEEEEPALVVSNGMSNREHDTHGYCDTVRYSQHFAKSRPNGSNQALTPNSKRKASGQLPGPPVKLSRNSSPDPLSQGVGQNRQERSRKRVLNSQSESTRGVITATSFPSKRTPQYARHTKSEPDNSLVNLSSPVRSSLKRGLKLKVAVSGAYSYSHETCEPKCLLRTEDVSTILLPMPLEGGSTEDFLSEYSYLQVNLAKVHSIKYEIANHTVLIERSVDATTPGLPKLYLVFDGPGDLAGFLKWVTMKRKEAVLLKREEVPGDKLIKTVNHLLQRSTKHKMPKSPNDTPKDAQDHLAEDIQLMAHKRTRRQTLVSQNDMRKSVSRSTKQATEAPEVIDDEDEITSVPETPQASASRTRRRFAVLAESPPTPKLWTKENPEWVEKNWRNSLVFPPQGKNRASVDANDIERLDEGEFLNDNLIIFYLRYLQDKLEKENPQVAERIHFHNTFFYDKLKPTRSGAGIKYDGVKGWTTKVDLFKKDFIVVPINEYQHWYVAIIYNPSKLDPSQQVSPIVAKPVALDLTTPEKPEKPETEVLTITDTQSTNPEADVEMQDGAHVVETELRRMSIGSAKGSVDIDADASRRVTTSQHEDERVKAAEKEIYDVDADSEIQPGSPPSSSAHRKMKKTGPGSKKHHDPNQPKIITLDSLGSAHSPACTHLKQYLMAELKDKKGIEISDPGALGMTAKGIPLQENHCDCGLYLLGYVRHFLENPDAFVHGLLHYDEPTWSFVSSDMRHEIRNLIFMLQAEQQKREDAEQEAKRQRKRQAAEERRNKSRPTSSASDDKEPLAISSSAATQGTQASSSEDTVSPQKPIKHDTIDASSILQPRPMAQSIETDEVVPADNDPQKILPESRVKTDAHGETKEPCEASTSMPGSFPGSQQMALSPKRSGSIDTQKGFIHGIKSPELRGHTSDNPVEVHDEADGSPSLMKELEDHIAQAKSPNTRRTPRKQASRLNSETRGSSVEAHQTLRSPSTNIAVILSSQKSPRKDYTVTKFPSSQTTETGHRSGMFSGATSQRQEETVVSVKYVGQRNRSKEDYKEGNETIVVD
ncbi:hypothetical protein PFICI_07767 [Pestalotiopsis fici W106-1]|uniref:Ubiquitin-like protease family profile domain-containing protein n=1 Tax=Pestalotiopsis fici (strain W106-1 / CGMCC3.15140) TaxID=1229662 RepID=W3X295_PESFW|nr:uncharacterized protein PFICI_07767 [Pestalotiopsis fici W106-1]ETS80238.1 hypothetical protein PFICI_07767 [Pestalotiopsis fici W106-1]